MRFPGSKLLSENLSTSTTPFDSIVRQCEDVNLSGYMAITFGEAEGLILFYLGEQINVIFRQASQIFVAGAATLKLRNTAEVREGKVSIFELPLDMAHMLRGLSNRKEIFERIFASSPLKDFIRRLAAEGHTGSIEVLTSQGTGMILHVRGRFSTAYLETEAGVTFEKKDALNKIYELLDREDVSAAVFQSDFSPDIWKTRQHGAKGKASRLQELLESKDDVLLGKKDAATPASSPAISNATRAPAPAPAVETPPVTPSRTEQPPKPLKEIATRRPLQEQVLLDIRDQTPSLLATFFFDLSSEAIASELVIAPAETAERVIVEKLPAFVKYLENLASMKGDDHIELLSMSTENFYLIVKRIPETDEGIALITDRSQPLTLSSSLLLNCAHRYVAMLAGASV